MLNNISWAGYVYANSIILFIYYAFVLIVYYRNDLRNYFFKFKEGSKPFAPSRMYPVEKAEVKTNERHLNGGDKSNSIDELLLSLQTIIKAGASRNFAKEELLLSVKLKLKQHFALQSSPAKDSIDLYIIESFENYCSIHLSDDEVSALWIK